MSSRRFCILEQRLMASSTMALFCGPLRMTRTRRPITEYSPERYRLVFESIGESVAKEADSERRLDGGFSRVWDRASAADEEEEGLSLPTKSATIMAVVVRPRPI